MDKQLRESAATEADALEYIPKAQRDKIPDEDFAGPGRTFPIDTQDHLDAAAHLIGHAENPDAVKHKAITIAKRKGFKLPDAWKEEDAKESAFAPPALGKTKVATLRTVFLEDGAVSLNGRQYGKEAVDKLIQSAQVQLSDPSNAPLTCYISHDAADQDNSLMLAGKITNVWREGTKAWASIDLVNTNAGRDMATQAAGGFMRTMSLRASNAEIKREKDSTWPTVGGSSLRLDGIDFTASPGISVAKIQNVALAENAFQGPQRLHEVFNAHAPLVEMAQKEAGMNRLNEAEQGGNTVGGYSPTSGDSPSMDGAPSQGAYGRMYNKPEDTSGSPMAGMDKQDGGNEIELEEAHDRAAMIQGRSCAPQRESVRWGRAFASMDTEQQKQFAQTLALLEAGKSISARNDKHLDVIHDALARHLGKSCVGESSKPRGGKYDPDGDGDDDSTNDPMKNPDWAQDQKNNMESAKKQKGGDSPMTEEEALKLLESKGYGVQKPKTAEEQLQERLDAMKAEQAAQLEAMKAEQAKQLEEQQKRMEEQTRVLIAQATPDPQRKSLVLGSNVKESSNGSHRPLRGNYLQEKIKGLDWERMAYDRTTPLPTDIIPLDLLMREFEHMYAVSYDDWAKQVYNIAPVYER